MSNDFKKDLVATIQQANANKKALNLVGNETKEFYGREPVGEKLCLREYSGLVEYQPTELVLTARSGTLLTDINSTLADNGQILGFEPPIFSGKATLGGTIATGLAGPRRPYSGSVSDFILGVKILNGKGEIVSFGGQVIKNVAGFDISRLMAGSLGCLGVILEVSMKVVPKAEKETTIIFDNHSQKAFIELMKSLALKPLPISASSWFNNQTRIRISGTRSGVQSAIDEIGGDKIDTNEDYWQSLKNYKHEFFDSKKAIIRGSLPQGCDAICDDIPQLIDWGGGVRWIIDQDNRSNFLSELDRHGGYATVFRNGDRSDEVFSKLPEELMKYHQRLKREFDPNGIFNPGRMYKGL